MRTRGTLLSFGSATAAALGRATDCSGDPPALPVLGAAGEMPDATAGHADLQDLGRVRNDQVAHPLGQGGASRGDWMLALKCAAQRAPLGVGEADEGPVVAGVGVWGASKVGHDFPISESRRSVHSSPQPLHTLSVSPRTPLGPQPTTEEVTSVELTTYHHYDYYYGVKCSEPKCPPNRIRSTIRNWCRRSR